MGNYTDKEFYPGPFAFWDFKEIDQLEYYARRNIEREGKNLLKNIAQEWDHAYPDMIQSPPKK